MGKMNLNVLIYKNGADYRIPQPLHAKSNIMYSYFGQCDAVERCREECGSSLVNSKLWVDDFEEGNDKDNNDQEDDLSLTGKYI